MNIALDVVCQTLNQKKKKNEKKRIRVDKKQNILWLHLFIIVNTDNHYVVEAKTPENKGALMIQLEGTTDMIRDDRMKSKSRAGMGFY